MVRRHSKPRALGTSKYGQLVLKRALLSLLVFRFQFLTLGLRLAVKGGSVENLTFSSERLPGQEKNPFTNISDFFSFFSFFFKYCSQEKNSLNLNFLGGRVGLGSSTPRE